ncbi:SMI1/KNR4 family protein [Streptomyces sp. SP17BM10]|uniref:SMI1/KNR4 family protein n=1 Tax=Streptomyces sp. SP17BM10 TaxID=3002530 RepID=UPI002E789E53|nr:SMI1/KNR4 family protein [Streptomyces sp. SP17BM10]MEE1787648.1 SMI1/KNR4 family protein [Streptomyces sp. SP17BM10]
MWRQLILELAPDAELAAPASDDTLADVERALGQRVPPDLAGLLRECDGVVRRGLDVVWDAARIARDNRGFRTTEDFRQLYMPFEPLMFFGDNGGGDLFAFVRTPERDHDVFVWDHETDSRSMVTGRLRQYLERSLREAGDWYL